MIIFYNVRKDVIADDELSMLFLSDLFAVASTNRSANIRSHERIVERNGNAVSAMGQIGHLPCAVTEAMGQG